MSKATVLILDDDAQVGNLLQTALASWGVMADVLSESPRALETIGQHDYDLLMLDVVMPDMNGIEATRQITAADPDCAVLALSINGGRRLVEQVVSAGAAGYVTKQTAGRDLVKAINALSAGDTYFSHGLTDP